MSAAFLAILGLALAQAPAPVTADNSSAIVVEKAITYGKGGDVDLQLDLARPQEGPGPFPVIVCIHGGGWKAGTRQSLDATIRTFAARGYVAATVSYRFAPKDPFPAQIEDCKAAIRWLRANAKMYRIDPERIGVVGFSAGAHLAALLGVTDKKDGLEGSGGSPDQSSRVQAVVSFFGPMDLTRNRTPETDSIFLIPFLNAKFEENPEPYRKASPIQYVTSDDPPFLFLHGTEDKLVSVEQSKIMDEKLRQAGVGSKVIIYDGEGHGWRGEKLLKSVTETAEFFDKQLKKRK